MPRRWPAHLEAQLTELVAGGEMTYVEIARVMGMNKNSIATKAQHLGLKNDTYMRRKTKHAHLRRPLLEFYLTHTAQECMEHFALTASEFKSCLTVAYQDPELAHIRKDKRRHDPWTMAETLELLRRAGVQPRSMIAASLKRGTKESVKEQLSRLGTKSKYMNGMPAKWAFSVFETEWKKLPIVKTLAGPKSGPGGKGKGDFRFRIVPWVALRPYLRADIDPLLKRYIRIMSNYQRWIWGGLSDQEIVHRIQQLTKEVPCRAAAM